jgi:hypothetical protein
MKEETKQHNDGLTPREQRFIASSLGIKDPKSGKSYFYTSDRSLATFLVYRNHKAKHVWIADQACYAFPMSEKLKASLDMASSEDGADLFHTIDRGIAIFSDLLVTEAIKYSAGFSGYSKVGGYWQKRRVSISGERV